MPPLTASFLDVYPDYPATGAVDEWRTTDYARLDRLGHVYLDYTGGGLYGDREFAAGSLLIPASDRARREIEALGLQGLAVRSAPTVVQTIDVDLPRIAMYTTWANTEKVGWVRLAFDRWEIPFDLIHKDHVQAGANLRSKYDVIVMPHQTQNGKSIVYENPKLSKPLPYKKGDTFKSMGMYAETDDVRGGMGLAGAAELQRSTRPARM